MQREVAPHEVNKSEDFDAITFSFDASAEAFKIISDNLYSRPVEAVVRELCCNAYDSHVKAGNADTPIVVKIPTRLDDTFFVQDFGTGLTPKEIKEVYTVVFRSDKTHTNELTGCFGLGSKSPFSVVSQFSVESVVKGRKWIYSCYLNDRRVPTIADMSKGGFSTDEPDGVKISFPSPGREKEFTEAAQKVFQFFAVEPKIIGKNVELWKDEFTHHEEGFYTLTRYGGNHPRAIMGNVCYDIDTSNFDSNISDSVILYFELGELTPTPSREYLQYDKRTIAAIEKKYKEFLEHFLSSTLKTVDKAKNLWEARKIMWKTENDYKYSLGSQIRQILSKATWNGLSIKPGDQIVVPHTIRKYVGSSRGQIEKDYSVADAIWVRRDPVFCLPDEKLGFISKTSYAAENDTTKNFFLLSADEEEQKNQVSVLKEEFGFPADFFIKTSTLSKRPPRAPAGRKHWANGKVKILNPRVRGEYKTHYWMDCKKEDLPEAGYYVFTSRGSWGEKSDVLSRHPMDLARVLNAFEFVGVTPPNVYGIIPSAEKTIPKEWKPVSELSFFFKWLLKDKAVKEVISLAELAEVTRYSSQRFWVDNVVEECHSFEKIKDKKVVELANVCKVMRNFEEQDRHYKRKRPGLDNFMFALTFFRMKDILDAEWMKKRLSAVGSKYPLMKHLSFDHGYRSKKRNFEEEVINYLNLLYTKG